MGQNAKKEKKHNDEFNPSGQPWILDQGQKRAAEIDLQGAVGEKADQLTKITFIPSAQNLSGELLDGAGFVGA